MKIIIWVCFLFFSLAYRKSAAVQKECQSKVDLGFLLDSSGSIQNFYKDEKSFIKSIAVAFGFGKDGAHASVITFSISAELSIKLNEYTTINSFNKAVDGIRLMNSLTRMDLALRLAQRKMFTRRNGGRPGVSKVLVLLTDGVQTKLSGYENPAKIAKELRKAGIKLIVVGMGNGVNMAELRGIAGSANPVFRANTFDELLSENFIQSVSTQVCKDIHPCDKDNGGCEDKCVRTNDKATCKCSQPGKVLGADGKSCNDGSLERTSYGMSILKTAPVQQTCRSIVDLGFLLDSSKSIMDNYNDEKSFIKSIAATFGLSEDGAHAGVITFSNGVELSIKLNKYTDISSFNKAVDKIPLMASVTRIDLALRLAQRKMFIPKNVGRPGVSKVLMLLTDGVQTKVYGYEKPAKIAKELRKAGIKLIVVGMGNEVNLAELAKIAGSTNKVFLANTFLQLLSDNFIKSVSTQVCKEIHPCDKDNGGCDDKCLKTGNKATCKCTQPGTVLGADRKSCVPQKICRSKVDVGFLLDSSRSIEANYKDEKSFMKSIADAFGFGKDDCHAGVITFSHTAELSIKLNKYKNITSFNKAVDKIALMNSVTRIDLALRLAQREMFISRNGGRSGISKVIMLLTDGVQTKVYGYEKPARIAKELRKAGIKLVVVGMGDEVNLAELTKIAGGANKVFLANTFHQLLSDKFIKSVSTQVCKEIHPCDRHNGGCDDKCVRKGNAGTCTCTQPGKVLRADGKSCVHPCDKDNGGCADKCLKTTNKATCKCTKDGKVLAANGKSCVHPCDKDNGDCADQCLKTNNKATCKCSQPDKVLGADGKSCETCQSKVDLGFLLDSSGSIMDNYKDEKSFIKSIAAAFGLSKDGARAGVITFSNDVELSIKLNKYTDLSSFSKAVDKIALMNSVTRIDLALRLAQRELFITKNGGRSGISKVIVLLTDGVQTEEDGSENPVKIAEELRNAGINLIVVGMGDGVDPDELENIAGDANNVFKASTFNQLLSDNFIQSVLTTVCENSKQVSSSYMRDTSSSRILYKKIVQENNM